MHRLLCSREAWGVPPANGPKARAAPFRAAEGFRLRHGGLLRTGADPGARGAGHATSPALPGDPHPPRPDRAEAGAARPAGRVFGASSRMPRQRNLSLRPLYQIRDPRAGGGGTRGRRAARSPLPGSEVPGSGCPEGRSGMRRHMFRRPLRIRAHGETGRPPRVRVHSIYCRPNPSFRPPSSPMPSDRPDPKPWSGRFREPTPCAGGALHRLGALRPASLPLRHRRLDRARHDARGGGGAQRHGARGDRRRARSDPRGHRRRAFRVARGPRRRAHECRGGAHPAHRGGRQEAAYRALAQRFR